MIKNSVNTDTDDVATTKSDFNTKGGFPGILFAAGSGTGTGKKFKFFKLKEKSVVPFPAGKKLISAFSCGHAGERLGKRL